MRVAVHPPAGADPLVIMLSGNAFIEFLFIPVISGFFLLLIIAVLFNNVVRGRRWHERWT
ncbi:MULTISPECIES: HPP family protein [unclassified Caballeronia]|uniref:HPP family protein n=1 Tax=Caballeronia sp. SBC2 TaxID=2705547 RepID=UPI0013EDCF69